MKVLFKNTGYFFKEIGTIMKLDLLSNMFSIFSLAFIFFMLSLVVSGGWISSHMINAIENEAEISVYYKDNIKESQVKNIVNEIDKISGIKDVFPIDKEEAEKKMHEILGKESRIIKLFDDNPFSAYIEVKVDLTQAEEITNKIENIQDVELVRDNREILDRLINISNLVNIIGILVIAAVSIATLVITSHIIRQGIYNNREQISTLRLLGAPEYFITLPFILEGLLMSIMSGLLSIVMIGFTDKYIYSQVSSALPFLLLPPLNKMIAGIGMLILILSFVLGLLGSIFGLKAIKS